MTGKNRNGNSRKQGKRKKHQRGRNSKQGRSTSRQPTAPTHQNSGHEKAGSILDPTSRARYRLNQHQTAEPRRAGAIGSPHPARGTDRHHQQKKPDHQKPTRPPGAGAPPAPPAFYFRPDHRERHQPPALLKMYLQPRAANAAPRTNGKSRAGRRKKTPPQAKKRNHKTAVHTNNNKSKSFFAVFVAHKYGRTEQPFLYDHDAGKRRKMFAIYATPRTAARK